MWQFLKFLLVKAQTPWTEVQTTVRIYLKRTTEEHRPAPATKTQLQLMIQHLAATGISNSLNSDNVSVQN